MKIGNVFGFVRRRGWIVVLGTALSVMVAVMLTKQTLNTYEAHASVAIANKTQIPGTTNYVDQPLSKQMANTFAQLITRPVILDEAQKRLNTKLDRSTLSKKITAATVSVKQPAVSDVSGLQQPPQQVEIRVRDTDPNFAANLANTLAQVFIEDNAGQFVAPGSLGLVEGALVPKTPVSPDLKTNAIAGGIVGFFLALMFAAIWEVAFERIRVTSDLDGQLGVSLLTTVDRFKKGVNVLEDDPDSAPAKSYRELRSNVRFLTTGADMKSLVVTSANVDEGKSTTATNLAIVLAQGGESVILVDADLRRYEPERQPDVSGSIGLTGLLKTDEPDIGAALIKTRWPNLWLLPAGALPPRPDELLATARMSRLIRSLRGMANYVIFDTPPLLNVPDAKVLADQADCALVVTAVGKTRTRALKRVIRTLNSTRASVLGVVLNKVAPPTSRPEPKPGIAQVAGAAEVKAQARADARAQLKAERALAKEEKALSKAQKQEKAPKPEKRSRQQKRLDEAAAAAAAAALPLPAVIPPTLPIEPKAIPDIEVLTPAAIREAAATQPVAAFSAQGASVKEAAHADPTVETPPVPVLPPPVVIITPTRTPVPVIAASANLDTSALEARLNSLQERLAGLRTASRADALRQATTARIPAAAPVAAPGATDKGVTDPKVEELLARLNDTMGLIQSLKRPATTAGKEA